MTPDPPTAPAARSGSRRNNFILLFVVLIAGSWITWHKVVRHYFVIRNFGVVEPDHIYRSGRFLSLMVKRLHDDYDLKTIIDLGAFHEGSDEDKAEQSMCEEVGITRYSFRHLEGDGTGDPNEFVAALRLVADENNHPVLIHCAAGAQRTTSLVLLYRHLIQGKPIPEVYPESFAHDHDPGRDWILMAWLAENLGVITRSYEDHLPITKNTHGQWVIDDQTSDSE